MARPLACRRPRNAKSTVSRLPKTCTIFSRRKPAGNRTGREILRQVEPVRLAGVGNYYPEFFAFFYLLPDYGCI